MILLDKRGHLVSDSHLLELHRFAHKIGLRRDWYQNKRLPHYDLTTEHMRQKAILAGAILVSSRRVVEATYIMKGECR